MTEQPGRARPTPAPADDTPPRRRPRVRRVVCNDLDYGPDEFATEPELIRTCVCCGTSVYVKRELLREGREPWCWNCIPTDTLLSIHPATMAGMTEQEADEALAEIHEWLRERDQRRAKKMLGILGWGIFQGVQNN